MLALPLPPPILESGVWGTFDWNSAHPFPMFKQEGPGWQVAREAVQGKQYGPFLELVSLGSLCGVA